MRNLIVSLSKTCAAGVAVALVSAPALASPPINGAVLNTRIFNDDPGSSLATVNSYPSLISFNDTVLDGNPGGFANRHNFRVSSDGGATSAIFVNGDNFRFYSDVNLTGRAEAGLQISPWWSPDVDGQFQVRSTDGEIAAFGGRLPFYSFSNPAGHNLRYTPGTTVRLGMKYDPNDNNGIHPGTIEYFYTDPTGTTYNSGKIPFDEGNVAEGAIHGNWGILSPAYVGGFIQGFIDSGNPANFAAVEFRNMSYVPEPTSLVLLGLAGLVALRRR